VAHQKKNNLIGLKLGHEIIEPVPSLFTFNLPNNTLTELSGVAM
jgi:predicted flavoprotein YhiN